MLRCHQLTTLTARRLYSTHTGPPPLLLRPAHGFVDACTDALRAGFLRVGVFIPRGSSAFSDLSSSSGFVGAGQVKTAAILTLLSRIPATPNATRALVIVRSAARAQQAAVQAERLFPHWTVEIDDGKAHQASGTADVTIATHRTLFDLARLAKYDPQHLKVIIVDEAHHAATMPYRRILWRFVPAVQCMATKELVKLVRKMPALRKIPVVGFSAAFTPHDESTVRRVFQQIVCTSGLAPLVRDRWIGNARVTTVHADLAPVSVSARTNDAGLARAVNTPAMNQRIVHTWLARAAGRSTLVLCSGMHVRALTDAFRAAGIDARCVHPKMVKADRRECVTQFGTGEFPVLVYHVNSNRIHAADLPAADCVFVVLPTSSPTLFAQMIGHGLSPSKDCHIFDFVASMPRTVDIVSTPVLFGLDSTTAIDGETLVSLDARSPSVADTFPDDVPVADADADTSFAPANYSNDLFSGDPSGAPDVRALSPNAWVGCDVENEKVYVLGLGRGFGYLYIKFVAAAGPEPGLGGCFVVTYTRTRVAEGTAHAPPTVAVPHPETSGTGERILSADTLADAVRGADAYAESRTAKGPMGERLLWTADWRAEPATEAQQNVLRTIWAQKRTPSTTHTAKSRVELDIVGLTKGEASDLISRMKHGDKDVVNGDGGGGDHAGPDIIGQSAFLAAEHFW